MVVGVKSFGLRERIHLLFFSFFSKHKKVNATITFFSVKPLPCSVYIPSVDITFVYIAIDISLQSALITLYLQVFTLVCSLHTFAVYMPCLHLVTLLLNLHIRFLNFIFVYYYVYFYIIHQLVYIICLHLHLRNCSIYTYNSCIPYLSILFALTFPLHLFT